MALGTELFNLATSFDPYGAYRKGQMAPEAYDVEQQKLGVEKQKLDLQKLQLGEQQKELMAEQGKPPELATMAQNVLGPQYKLTDDTGLPTAAGQMNTLLLQGKQEADQGQKLLRQAQLETDPKAKASLISEGRRLLNNAVKYQGDAKSIAQKEQNTALYGLATATNQSDWNNVVKGWENNGLPIPKGFPTEYSPENQKKIAAMAPLEVQQKIEKELRDRQKEKDDTTEKQLRIRKLQAQERDGWKTPKGAKGGGEGGEMPTSLVKPGGTSIKKINDYFPGISFAGTKSQNQDKRNTIDSGALSLTTAEDLKQYAKEHSDQLGRQGQIQQTIERYVDSLKSGKSLDDIKDDGQPALVFAKKYAAYLVGYERTLAGTGRGMTVSFQNRFNTLMSQNQFNAKGFEQLMNEQMQEISSTVASKDPAITGKGLLEYGNNIKSRSKLDFEDKTKEQPKTEKSSDIKQMATQAFGGYDESKYQYRINPETGKVQRALK
jgi:hypothetical protein